MIIRRGLMRVSKLSIVVGFLFAVLYSQASDELAKVGTSGAQFLKYPVGARGAALGNGLIVNVQDASAVFWSPAGLARIEGMSAFYTHTSLFLDMSFDGASVVYTHPKYGNVGLNFVHFSSGDMEETTVEQQDGTGNKFQFTDLALGLSYAQSFTNRFSLGGNLRYIQEDLAAGLGSDGEYSAKNWSVDIGVLYLTDFKGLTLGMKIANFGPQLEPEGEFQDWDNGNPVMDPSSPTDTLNLNYKEYHMPLSFQFGLGFDPIHVGPHRLTLFAALEHPNDNIEVLNFAGEYTFKVPAAELALRSGYSLGHDIKGLTFGFGINYQGFQLDYAMVDYGVLKFVNTFSITFLR